ncbi:MAG: hypothetical protein QOD68_1323 [Actinomycetota bacterium]|jgi:hypothetical protein|nr:hypothetical protein [Actinomycetota bacterium]
MTTTSASTARNAGQPPEDRLAAPLAILLWVVVLAALTYGVVSTLQKVVELFS